MTDTNTPWAPTKPQAKQKKEGLRLHLWLIANAYAWMFTGLKLTGVIAWSWWAVFSPLLWFAGILVALGIILVILKGLARGRQ